MFSTSFTSFSVLLYFPLSINLFVFMHGFNAISSNIDEAFLSNPSVVFVFGDLRFFLRKSFFCLSLNFLNIILEISLIFS